MNKISFKSMAALLISLLMVLSSVSATMVSADIEIPGEISFAEDAAEEQPAEESGESGAFEGASAEQPEEEQPAEESGEPGEPGESGAFEDASAEQPEKEQAAEEQPEESGDSGDSGEPGLPEVTAGEPAEPEVEYENYYLSSPSRENIDGNNYLIWRTNGWDGAVTNLEMPVLRLAKEFCVEFASRPTGNMEFILVNAATGWWGQTGGITRPANTAPYRATIALPSANRWNDFISEDGGKMQLVQWGVNLPDVSRSYIVIPKFTVIESYPAKTIYEYGEDLELAGLSVWTYIPSKNGYDFVELTNENASVSGYDPWYFFGEQTVTVTYNNIYKASFGVTVSPPEYDLTVTMPQINGIAKPRVGSAPVESIIETQQYTGTVTWSPAPTDGVFDELTAYTATIALTAKQYFTLEGVAADFFQVAGASSVTFDAASGAVAALFPATAKRLDKYEMRDIGAADFVKEMNIGWNLGNTFDATGNGDAETAWVSVRTTKAMIDKIADAGFDVLRVPITWTTGGGAFQRVGAGPEYTVAPWFLARIEEVVNYGLDNGMYVVINMHHDSWMTAMTESGWIDNNVRVEAIWNQVAEYFKDYGDHLIFETMNEPRAAGANEWTGDYSNYVIVNRYNQMILDTIRGTGGNNVNRFIMAPSYAASSSVGIMGSWIMPEDVSENKIIASVHSYTPYNFALNVDNAYNQWGTDADKRELKTLFANINDAFVGKGIPAIIGEYGAMNKNNEAIRAEWAKYFIAGAKEYGIPCVWWDNNAFSSGERFGLLNRNNMTFPYPLVLQGLMDGLTFELPELPEPPAPPPMRQGRAIYGAPVLGAGDALWAKAPELPVDRLLWTESGATGTAKVLWDGGNIYVQVKVNDPVLNDAASADHEKDSVEIFFNETNSKSVTYTPGMGQYRVNFKNGKSGAAAGLESYAEITGYGYLIEIKMPFKVHAPAKGDLIGFDVQINDAANGKRESVAMWSDVTGDSWQNGSKWGELRLSFEPKTVSFKVDGNIIGTAEVEAGDTACKPEDPVKQGYDFTGWYLDGGLYDFGTPVTSDIALAAGWELTKSVTVNGVDLDIINNNGVAAITIIENEMLMILSAPEIIIELPAYEAAELLIPASAFKNTDKNFTIVTAKGQDSVKTKMLWNNSGKERLITMRNGKISVSNK